MPCLDAKQPRGSSASCGGRERLRLGPPGLAELTCQVLRPWKKKKRAKPHTTEVQTMQSRETSSRRSPLRSCRGGSGQGGRLGEAPTIPEREAPPARVVAPS